MTEKTFLSVAKQELERLHLEAEVLERIVKRYVDVDAPPKPARQRAATNGRARAGRSKKTGSRRTSKYSAIIDALVQAGENGITSDELFAEAGKLGVDITRDALRRLIWLYRTQKKVRTTDDRHVWIRPPV